MESNINKLIEAIELNTKYSRKSHKLQVEMNVTDVQGTYGYKQIINAKILERIVICEHCQQRKNQSSQWCKAIDPMGGIHNWKPIFIPTVIASGKTFEDSLINLFNKLLK